MIITVSREISMGHRLPTYPGICASLHGHNVRFEVDITTEKFTDFKDVDRHLEMLLSELDHAMVLHVDDSRGRAACAELGDVQRVVLLSVEPTTESLAFLLFNEMGLRYNVTSVKVYETSKYSAQAKYASQGVMRV